MTTIDVRDLDNRLAEIVQQVKNGETIQLVEAGRAIAQITPIQRAYSEEEGRAFLAKLDRMAEEISRYLPEHVDAVEAVREIRGE